jgi:hypothetical protein
MKVTAFVAILGLTIAASSADAVLAATACDALAGSWEYVTPTDPGRINIAKQTDGTYLAVWIIARPARNADAGAWQGRCDEQGQRLRWRILYSTDASAVGTEHVQEWEMSGDTVRYWLLTPEGKRGPQGAARRLK